MRIRPANFLSALFASSILAGASSALTGVGIPVCLGDGTGPACPCGNSGPPGAGCMNSFGTGATLTATNTSGTASVALDIGTIDPVILGVTGLPPGATTVFFQGSIVGWMAWGDGLRCVANPFQVKLGIKFATAGGTSSYPQTGDNALALQSWVNTPLPAPCSRTYQVWYRNAAAFCTPFAYNMSSAVETPWVP